MEIFQHIEQWHAENQQLGLSPKISDNWTPAQHKRFLHDWNDDELILQANRGKKTSHDKMMDGEKEQISHGQDERPFNIKSATQVNIKKFRMTGINYRVQFTPMLLLMLKFQIYTNSCMKYFQQILDKTIGGVVPQDHVCIMLHSNQLKYPTMFPFMAPDCLTTERIPEEFEQST